MNLRIALFLLVAVIQLAVPGWMIFEQEQILKYGTEYKLETMPVDPYDLFRGRYVALRFKAAEFEQKGNQDLTWGTKVYVALKKNADGFAEVDRISREPIQGDNVFRATVRNVRKDEKIQLEFPFHKYFMEESLAPEAEKIYREASRGNSKQKVWALIRIRSGKAALADLVIDGEPIRDYLRTHSRPKHP